LPGTRHDHEGAQSIMKWIYIIITAVLFWLIFHGCYVPTHADIMRTKIYNSCFNYPADTISRYFSSNYNQGE
jgi:hypothetical protein